MHRCVAVKNVHQHTHYEICFITHKSFSRKIDKKIIDEMFEFYKLQFTNVERKMMRIVER